MCVYVCSQGALCVLNSLQNNAGVLERLKARQDNPAVQFQAMQGFLHRTGITVSANISLSCKCGFDCVLVEFAIIGGVVSKSLVR